MSTIFISGGSRGIGFQLVKLYASGKGNTVFTTTRSTSKSVALTDLAKELGNIKVLELEASSEESIAALEKALPNVITDGVDVFIANAGISDAYYPILEAPRKVYEEHYNVNVLATIALTKILYPYLLKNKTRKIIFISSGAGQITDFAPVSFSAYGQSKAAINYTAKALSFELGPEEFTVVPIHPGIVSTDMGKAALESAPEHVVEVFKHQSISPEASATGLYTVIEGLSRESSGKFYDYQGTELRY